MQVLCIYCNLFLIFPWLYKHFKPFFQFRTPPIYFDPLDPLFLGTLGMLGYAQQYSKTQPIENFHDYLDVNNQLDPYFFS